MSHYSVLVFQDEDSYSVEEMLEPFDENRGVKSYINRTKEELIAEAKNEQEIYRNQEPKFKGLFSAEELEEYLAIKTDEEYYDFAIKHLVYGELDEDGNEICYYNPDAKWDWYAYGGRWSGLLHTKDGEEVDEGYVRDLDFSPNKDDYNYYSRFWEVNVEGAALYDTETEEMYSTYYNPEFLKERYKTKERFATCMSGFSTFAVIMPGGTWWEKGQMGWFGCSDETDEEAVEWDTSYYENFIAEAHPDWYVTVIDCHI